MPSLDEATYLNAALLVAGERRGTPLADLPMQEFTLSTRYYPPLWVWSVCSAMEALGYRFSSILALTWVMGILALVAVYRTGTTLADRWTGGLASLLLACFPAFSSAATGSFMDYGMACWAAIAFAFFVDYARHGRWWTLLGWTVAVAAGQATRWTFVVFVFAVLVPPFLAGIIRPDDARRSFHRGFAMPALAAVVGFVPFLVWLATMGEPALLLSNTGSESSEFTYTQSIVFYLWAVFVDGIGSGLTPLLVLAVLAPGLYGRRDRWGLVVWILLCLLFFSGIARKRAMYVLYIYPAVALLLAVGLYSLRIKVLRAPASILSAVMALGFCVHSVVRYPVDDRRLFEEVLSTVDDAWYGPRPPVVGIHRPFYPDPEPFNSLVFSFESVAAGSGGKTWLEHSAVMEHAGHTCDEDRALDFLVLACTPELLPECTPSSLEATPPTVACTHLTFLDVFPASHRGERFEGWVFVFAVRPRG